MKPATIGTPILLTIGHSTHTSKRLLGLLRAHGVQRVIDVRRVPLSRTNPQFNRDTLRRSLRSSRIGYVYLGTLGGRRRPAEDSLNMAWRNASFRGFADYMHTAEFQAGLERLLRLLGQKRSALLCAEAVPWRCHRSLIADAVTAIGIRVEHITGEKSIRLHTFPPFARVTGSQVSYPAEDPGATSFPRLKPGKKRPDRTGATGR